ncbi:hypothetical protein GCM10027089_30500 [Nocardia thraciensis]
MRRPFGDPGGLSGLVQLEPVGAGAEGRSVRGGGQAERRAGIGEQMRDPLGRIGRVHRHEGRAGLRYRPDRQHRFDAAGDADRDRITRADPAVDEFAGQP